MKDYVSKHYEGQLKNKIWKTLIQPGQKKN
jgi:hypothetical protein